MHAWGVVFHQAAVFFHGDVGCGGVQKGFIGLPMGSIVGNLSIPHLLIINIRVEVCLG